MARAARRINDHETRDPSWDFYPDTVLHIAGSAATCVVDLRESVTKTTQQILRDLGPSEEFAVITADSPFGRTVDAEDNERCRLRLQTDIAKATLPHVPADGVSPDGLHRDRGFAVWCTRDQARDLAERYEQTAFFWFDGEAIWIVAARDDLPNVKLPA